MNRNSMRKLILKNQLSPGDILTLTAAVRDLHLSNPGIFLTDVRTSCPALWENNPFITRLEESDPEVEIIQCEYPLIHKSNEVPYHMIHGFRLFLQDRLGVKIEPHAFKGDIHLSVIEKSWMSQVEEEQGLGARFWIIVSGGKHDFTAKWWDPDRTQKVVDHFQGRIRFVQCGEANHHHPKLQGVIDLVGKTDLRQMVRLMWHADGVICPVTMFMHLAAAVETKSGRPKNRPCVVIAGGREPSHWEAYPHHQYLHTNGALPCCDNGGCWKSRVEPLGDGDEKDASLCLRPVTLASGRKLPECLDMITADDVIRAVETYLKFESEPKPINLGPQPYSLTLVSKKIPESIGLLRKNRCPECHRDGDSDDHFCGHCGCCLKMENPNFRPNRFSVVGE
jgi:ADP-heptose:LPS heptosyltransferase